MVLFVSSRYECAAGAFACSNSVALAVLYPRMNPQSGPLYSFIHLPSANHCGVHLVLVFITRHRRTVTGLEAYRLARINHHLDSHC